MLITPFTHKVSLFFASVIKVKLVRDVGLQTYKMPLRTAKNISTKLGFRISDVIASGHYPLLLETLFIPFHRMPSENIINWYYNTFDPLNDSAERKNLLHSFAHTFVIKAISK
jgi:hypothetical protein